MKFLSFDFSTFIFWYFVICFLIILQLCFAVRQLFFDRAAVVLCSPTHTVGRFLTAQLPNSSAVMFCLFSSCLLTFRQLFLASAVVFLSFGSCFLTFGSCVLIFRQLLFAGSAVVFCRLGCYFLLVQHEVETWNRKR